MNTIATKTQLPVQQIVQWCGIARGKFYDWRKRYGKVNEHNGLVPRDHWIEEWERQSVIDYFDCHPLDGYRRLTFMMLDEDVVAVSPSTTYRVLSKAGRLDRWNPKPLEEGNGLRSAAASAPALAHGYLVLEPGWDVLLPLLVSGWCEPRGGSLGDS